MREWYSQKFCEYPEYIKLVNIPADCVSSCHLFQIIVNDRDGLMMYLNANDVFPGVHYIVNTDYKMYSYGKGACPNAEFVSKHILSLPMHMGVPYNDVQYLSGLVVKYLMDIRKEEIVNYETQSQI